MQSLYENLNGTYYSYNDYQLPSLHLPTEKEYNICVFGERHRRFLKQNHRIIYYNLLTKGTLYSYLDDVNTRAETLFYNLLNELVKRENLTEDLKQNKPQQWIQGHNNIKNQAMEIVNSKIIYNYI